MDTLWKARSLVIDSLLRGPPVAVFQPQRLAQTGTPPSGGPPEEIVVKYRIANWHDHQHYKDRAPPWIKLHHTILTSEMWVMGDDASRALAIACMLLAARNKECDGTFNGDPEYVKRFAYLSGKPDFKPLIQYGFLEVVQDASSTLAECITETETEKRREEDTYAPTRAEKPARSVPKVEHVRFVNGHEDPVGHFDVAKEIRLQWLAAYPGVQIGTELEKAAAWAAANPTKRKKDWRRFLNNWMSRAQERVR